MAGHLRLTETSYDVTEIYDKSGYSPLHFAAYKNSDRLAEVLIRFVSLPSLIKTAQILKSDEEDQTEEQRAERKVVLQDWINNPSRGEEGFTAMHFASFHGNIEFLRRLVELGGNIHIKNKQDINLLHTAAQGDAPVSLAYCIRNGLDPQARDNK